LCGNATTSFRKLTENEIPHIRPTSVIRKPRTGNKVSMYNVTVHFRFSRVEVGRFGSVWVELGRVGSRRVNRVEARF